MVVTALGLLLALTQVPDTSFYANAETARLIARARERHRIQDTLVHDYTATVRTRIDAGFGRSRFAHIVPLAAVETAAQITWARPNDLHVKITGVRSASSIQGAKVEGSFSNPWFVPRGLGDSIRFVDQELPETPALHPLASNGDDYYRFAIFDSLTLELPDRKVSAIGVRVQPKRTGPSLIAGNLWLDAETAEVVRMTFTYLGDFLWSKPDSSTRADSIRAIHDNQKASRILKVDAELEYALHESRYWMPYRQLVTLTVEVPFFLNVTVPVRFVTTFGDYEMNRGAAPQFTIEPAERGKWNKCRREGEDTTCARIRGSDRHPEKGFVRAEGWDNGHWELEMPSRDSLATYVWPDQLALQPDPATERLIKETTETLAKMEQTLPADWVGRNLSGPAIERISDLFRFNRVEGPSVGGGYQISRGFNALLASARFGISDHRVTGSLGFRRDAPSGRLDISAWRLMHEAEPWTHGSSFGNSLNALLATHDDADYYLSLGGGVSFLGNNGLARDLALDLHFEHATSVASRARSAINDALGGSGFFPANALIRDGDYLAASASRRTIRLPLDLTFGADGLAGVGDGASGVMSGRVWMSARAKFTVLGRGAALSARTATEIGDDTPQMQFRVGGPETVRGYDYGYRKGRSGWAAQADLALTHSGIVAPVIFADIGNTFTSAIPLISAGGGLSILGGMIRFNLSGGLQPKTHLRFDLLFRAAR